jgi:hypothetical protein
MYTHFVALMVVTKDYCLVGVTLLCPVDRYQPPFSDYTKQGAGSSRT